MTKRCDKCGQVIRKRSDEEQNMLFGIIRMAADNWPEGHPFQPKGPTIQEQAEHLRAWLLIEAKHCRTLFIDDPASQEAIVSIGLAFCNNKRYFRLKRNGAGYVLMIPKTIKKYGPDKISVAEFRAAVTAVYEIIEAATRITPELYKKEQEAKKRRAA